MTERWIKLEGAVNVRDLGGLPTRDGRTTRFGRVLRADNLQDLTERDIDRLVGTIGVSDVLDLRSGVEVRSEGPGPLSGFDGVVTHHLSLYREKPPSDTNGDGAVLPDDVLPWLRPGDDDVQIWNSTGLYYTKYLFRRPDSVVTALRKLSMSAGASIVHCAAGKDRTGVICALALSVADVERDAIVADYEATGERLRDILRRLAATETYGYTVDEDVIDSHYPRAEVMETFLNYVDKELGGPLTWLAEQGWTDKDTATLRDRLLASE
ncbi:MAG TPA: tyrosine-protein phosphatase [Jiangellaceae bacterium]